MPNEELWDRIDSLAKEASEEFGEARVGYMLTQIACIGRLYKRQGIKQLFDAINYHCALFFADSFITEVTKPVKKNSRPK